MEEEELSSSVETDSDAEESTTTASRHAEPKNLEAKPISKDEEKITNEASASPEKEAAASKAVV